MKRTEYDENLYTLEKERDSLPSGSISTKRIKGKEYYYHRTYEGKKLKEKYIPRKDVDSLRAGISRRHAIERRIDELRENEKPYTPLTEVFLTEVVTGDYLASLVEPVSGYRKRSIFRSLSSYIYSDISDRVFVLYGLRRSGKTTLIRQMIRDMNGDEWERTAYIRISPGDTLSSLCRDLKRLQSLHYRYIFIDEVTLLKDFIEGAAVLSDIYASSGMKIVLSGTDSLGFILSEDEELYDRTVTLHTTFIPYREFEEVLGIRGVDEYIRYGGTMCRSGKDYNGRNLPFGSRESTDEYINSSIAVNIQHSLTYYKDGGHFRSLYNLYSEGELTSAVNRVIEDINHRFTAEVLTRDFRSGDLAISRRNLRKDRNAPPVMDSVDISAVTEKLRNLLDIRNRDEQKVKVDDVIASEISEYLTLLDLIHYVDVVSVGEKRRKDRRVLISQPGLRYAQAEALIQSLLEDPAFEQLSWDERSYITVRISNEIMGRMLEDIVLLETKLAYTDKEVFVLKFPVGEFDMVVFDRVNGGADIYEIKHSTEKNPAQSRHLIDEEKIRITEHYYGKIGSRTVLYRGETENRDDVSYINVEEYLRSLPEVQSVTYL